MPFERVSIEDERELEQKVIDEISAIEKGLTVIDNQVPTDGKEKLDILCHDKNRQLVILELKMNEDDDMLFQGLIYLDYCNRMKSTLKVTYKDFRVNDEETPRLILLAPSFSDNMLKVVKYIDTVQIDLYEWEYLKLGDQEGLYVKPISVAVLKEERRPWSEEKRREWIQNDEVRKNYVKVYDLIKNLNPKVKIVNHYDWVSCKYRNKVFAYLSVRRTTPYFWLDYKDKTGFHSVKVENITEFNEELKSKVIKGFELVGGKFSTTTEKEKPTPSKEEGE